MDWTIRLNRALDYIESCLENEVDFDFDGFLLLVTDVQTILFQMLKCILIMIYLKKNISMSFGIPLLKNNLAMSNRNTK